MNIKDVHDKAVKYFSDWVKINDDKSHWTIEYFHIGEGVNETMSFPHCWKCVTVNHCWFIDQEGLRPQEFDYNKYQVNELLDKEGLYHPNCHCEKQIIATPKVKDIKIVEKTIGKDNVFMDKIIGYIIVKKPYWFYDWGYTDEDIQLYADNFKEKVIKEYAKGNYKIFKHDQYGVGINIFIGFPGIKHKQGHVYNIKSGWTVYPNGQLKPNTLIAGWNEV